MKTSFNPPVHPFVLHQCSCKMAHLSNTVEQVRPTKLTHPVRDAFYLICLWQLHLSSLSSLRNENTRDFYDDFSLSDMLTAAGFEFECSANIRLVLRLITSAALEKLQRVIAARERRVTSSWQWNVMALQVSIAFARSFHVIWQYCNQRLLSRPNQGPSPVTSALCVFHPAVDRKQN